MFEKLLTIWARVLPYIDQKVGKLRKNLRSKGPASRLSRVHVAFVSRNIVRISRFNAATPISEKFASVVVSNQGLTE